MRTQRASLVLLFMAADKAVKARGQVDDILKECSTAVVENNNPRAIFTGLGNEVIPPVFKV